MRGECSPDHEKASLGLLLGAWERVVDLEELEPICELLGSVAEQIYGCPTQIVLADKVDGEPFGNEVFVPGSKDVLAYVCFSSKEYRLVEPLDQLFLRLVSWSITHNRLRQEAEHRKRLVDSLRLARRILEESLPVEKLRSDGWEVSGCLRSADHLGGDIFAYVAERGQVGFLLADAVGHGLDSALLASECRALWSALHSSKRDLSAVAARISRLLYSHTGAERYVAATFGRCFPDGRLEVVCCGQGPHYVTGASEVIRLDEPDMPLGLFPDQTFQVRRLTLKPGQSVLFTSDGMADLRDGQGREFGEERILATLRNLPACPQKIVDGLLQALDLHRGENLPTDDISALALVCYKTST